jgi:triacylglycerol lipase
VPQKSRTALSDRVQMLIPPLLWNRPRLREHDGDKVVLLHGLWRSRHAMEPLARRLDQEGYSTLNLPYPSATQSLDRIVCEIREKVQEFAGDRTVHFVTHSLGGIIARMLIAELTPWKQGRLVMMAPPNSGSEIIDWISRKPLLRSIMGPAARSLATGGVPSHLPALPPDLEAIVIMGNRASIPFFGKLLDPENDGIVSAERGKIEGLRGFSVVAADHTFIQMFLKTGETAPATSAIR